MHYAWNHHLSIFWKLGLKMKLKGKCFSDNPHENNYAEKELQDQVKMFTFPLNPKLQ